MSFNVNETLTAGDIPADVIPHLVWAELLAGVSKALVFKEVVTITDVLRGAAGTKISVPALSTRFTATTVSEATLDSSGYTPADPSVTDTDISIGDQVYVAFRLSDILKEDQPNFGWLQITLRDAGRAIAEYEDSAIRDVLIAGVGNSGSAGTAGTLKFDDVVDLLAKHKNDSWKATPGYAPWLIIAPDQEADLVKDTRYHSSRRYAVANVGGLAGADMKNDVEELYADCRVRVSENMTAALALIVFPQHPTYGPVAMHAYKRPLTVKSQREELYGRELWAASMRYGTSVIQANGVGLISNC